MLRTPHPYDIDDDLECHLSEGFTMQYQVVQAIKSVIEEPKINVLLLLDPNKDLQEGAVTRTSHNKTMMIGITLHTQAAIKNSLNHRHGRSYFC